MTEYGELIATGVQSGGAAVIADLAHKAAAREVLTLVEGRALGIVLADGQSVHPIDLDDYAARPDRKKGVVALTDADSFVGYTNRHRDDDATTLWSNVEAGTVIAVFDDHVQDIAAAGWGSHRAVLTLAATPDWKHWTSLDGQLVNQTKFAEHIEDGATCVSDPSAADMLEIAQTFHAKKGVDFKSSSRLKSGEVQFQFEETVAARAGAKGTLEIPDVIALDLAPFEGGPVYKLQARFRYRINDGQLALGYRLIRPEDARRAAFNDLTASISDGVQLPVFAGVPRR